ncbi:inositol monophosphatase family protein [Commensalibacter oyaizuii]|uniref:Inositol monophosphatase family protein n=1 Tax=Commensalibacter oyaizuii TaxID=3043873 RepID=A0ABT6Q1Q0_9PROT|nr:inositol monophosphatase family protein [Commensalibacter sp. TBRC 16381]MDI2091013.1 inositol monophosphatase family protein [Commensalibacter sp. TBRC 16381]
MSDALSRRFEAAQTIVQKAADMALAMRPAPGGPQGSLKHAQDWLTETDGKVESFISQEMKALFPDDGFQGEEEGQTRTGSLKWVVDPIDGTANYARGRNRWCVSLGLMDGDTPVLGVVAAPCVQEFYTARLNHGAFMNGKPIHASPVKDPKISMIELGWSHVSKREEFLKHADAILKTGAMIRTIGSGTMSLVDVASGRSDGHFEMAINLWDVAAALVLLKEAGAYTSSFLKDGGLHQPTPVLTAAPGIADLLSKTVNIPLEAP